MTFGELYQNVICLNRDRYQGIDFFLVSRELQIWLLVKLFWRYGLDTKIWSAGTTIDKWLSIIDRLDARLY